MFFPALSILPTSLAFTSALNQSRYIGGHPALFGSVPIAPVPWCPHQAASVAPNVDGGYAGDGGGGRSELPDFRAIHRLAAPLPRCRS